MVSSQGKACVEIGKNTKNSNKDGDRIERYNDKRLKEMTLNWTNINLETGPHEYSSGPLYYNYSVRKYKARAIGKHGKILSSLRDPVHYH